MWIFWPDTRGLPLEEIAAIFGDADEVAIYQREIDLDGMPKSKETLPADAEQKNLESLEEQEVV
jgi:hypothetical protein